MPIPDRKHAVVGRYSGRTESSQSFQQHKRKGYTRKELAAFTGLSQPETAKLCKQIGIPLSRWVPGTNFDVNQTRDGLTLEQVTQFLLAVYTWKATQVERAQAKGLLGVERRSPRPKSEDTPCSDGSDG